MLAGSRSVRRRLYTFSECQRADDQRDRASRPNQSRGILGAGHSNSICIALHLFVNDAELSISLHAHTRAVFQGNCPHVR
jgi:hypothetical protein